MTIRQAWLQNLQARFQNRNNQNALPHAGVSLEDLRELSVGNPEQAKIILEYEKLKEDNHWSKPFLTFVAGALIPLIGLVLVARDKQQEIAQKDAEILQYLQLASYLILVIATIGIKIFFQYINQDKISLDEKLFSRFALIIKNVPLYYQLEDLKDEIRGIDPKIEFN